MSGRTAEQMILYKNRVVIEGVISHPLDGDLSGKNLIGIILNLPKRFVMLKLTW